MDESQGRPADRLLVVVGNGRVTAEPDLARITFSVGGERHGTQAAARTDTAERMKRCIDALTASGIASRDLSTGHFAAGPEYEYRDGRQKLVGYTVRTTLNVTVRDLDAAGEIIDRVMAAGASSLEGPSFELENPDALRIAAHTGAARDARATADALATALGVTIAGIARIAPRETPQPGPIPVVAMRAMAAPEMGAGTSIESGTIEVTATVEVSFIIG